MAGTAVRILIALVYYYFGFLLSCLVLPFMILKAIFGGGPGISKLFKREKHDHLPEFAEKDFEHNYIRIKSGIRFHYVHAGSENDPLMLCLHGFPECWYSWRHIMKKFSSQYHVVSIDMRGYGDSDKPESIGQYHLDYLVTDVQEIITGLGYKKAVVVGHDWGGIVAWEVAMFYPEVVDKLIVINAPMLKAFREFMAHYPSQILRSWYIFFFQIPFVAEFVIGYDDYDFVPSMLRRFQKDVTSDEIEIYKRAVGRFLKYSINYYRASNPLYSGVGLRRVRKEIVQPTLLVWGKDDEALDHRCIPFIAKYVPGISTHIIEGAGHWVAHEQPEQVHNAIEEFLERNQ